MMMPIHNVNDVRQISTGRHARHRQHFLNTVNESSSRNYFKYMYRYVDLDSTHMLEARLDLLVYMYM